ncbi:MAG: hypothetical protein JW761_14345 [Prolixibacteraceae bacterium]|nr:hypothetical protein [Prolixibacteraceae bacterium]
MIPFLSFSQVQTIGIPGIHNFSKSEYNGGTQNWGIAQDDKGFIYFANNDGLLQYDGLQWDIIEISSNSPVRSVLVDSKNRVFVGLINDFGIIEHNPPGMPRFRSLRNLLPKDFADFDDVWRIFEIPEGVVFQCYDYAFLFKDDNLDILTPNQRFHFSFQVRNRLFFHEPGIGLFEFREGKLEFLNWSGQLKNKEVSIMLEADDNGILIGTSGEGIYYLTNGKLEKWETPVSAWIQRNKLYSATRILDDYYAFGTIVNGIVIADKNGNIVQSISRNEGLQNNTVLSIFSDKDRNLWLGLDNGIDFIGVNSPISYITDAEDIGTGYCCQVFSKNLYLGTNQGLYVKPYGYEYNNKPFQLVENTVGQVWSLAVFDGQLICGHNTGTYIVNGKTAEKISDVEGVWKYIQLKNHPGYLLGGHYNGLMLLRKGQKGWEFYKKLTGFQESSRYLYQDEHGAIWISHGGKGVFRVVLNEEPDSIMGFTLFSQKDGLPSDKGNIIFRLNNQLYVSTENKIYSYDAPENSFVLADEVNELLMVEDRIKTLKQDDKGNIWYISGKESGVLRLNEDLTYTRITSPFEILNGEYVNEFEFIYPYDENNLFIGIYDGFAHYSSQYLKSYSKPFKTLITKVEIPYLDSMLYLNRFVSDSSYVFPFYKNEFRIHYTALFFENFGQMKFSYYLENYSDEWSNWSVDSYKDFTNLHEGDYVFKLKAKNIYGAESEISEFHFKITPPRHRSVTAYYIYFFFMALLVFLLVKFLLYRIELSKAKQRIMHQNELQRQEEEFQHEALIAEKEIIRLRNEKLRAEKMHLDKELANQTMNILQKNKLLMKLNEELQRIQNSTEDSSVITRLVLIKKRIKRELDNKQQNQLFETYFEEVHADFFKRLKDQFPLLSPNDLRLCAYIRMNIPTKEIATLLNISSRGVEIHRYRLRKKMNLPREVNLITFLSGI